jgi:hypothetical protein
MFSIIFFNLLSLIFFSVVNIGFGYWKGKSVQDDIKKALRFAFVLLISAFALVYFMVWYYEKEGGF